MPKRSDGTRLAPTENCQMMQDEPLNTEKGLQEAVQAAKTQADTHPTYVAWVKRLAEGIERVAQADRAERRSLAFHQFIWEENPVSAVGMGTVDISNAIESEEFRDWFANKSLGAVPEGRDSRLAHHKRFLDEIEEQLKKYSDRTPWVKIFRVLALLYPKDFTTITPRPRTKAFYRELIGKAPADPVKRQMDIVARFEQVLGPTGDSCPDLAERMTLPWLVVDWSPEKEESERFIPEAEKPELKPLPAVQRRKGLTSIKGGLGTMLNSLSFISQGVTKEELMDHLRTELPDYRDSSLGTLFNILKSEFFVIQQEGDLITVTEQGDALLETSDPNDLVPGLLTRILGVDNVLVHLRDGGPALNTELIELLQRVNPGWTTSFAPNAMLKWLRDFGLTRIDDYGKTALTENGVEWAKLIDWEPGFLARESEPPPVISPTESLDVAGQVDLSRLVAAATKETSFDSDIIKRLHFGLLSKQARHFAILAGLSGSGKTLLAKRYADALCAQFGEDDGERVLVQAVQPGWFDPTPLFGYVNPLSRENKYVRPATVDFLLKALKSPKSPFVLILDEMNLSHPEQYFAPILSAMETGDLIRFHNEADIFDGVPSSIPYPKNLVIIGTINMDETTHGISDKVLDRAYTIEFWDIDLGSYPGWVRDGLPGPEMTKVREALVDLGSVLAPVRLHFGWRTVVDVLDYLELLRKSDPSADIDEWLDEVVYARVLPKLRGVESKRLLEALEASREICVARKLPRCATKLHQLQDDLRETGTMRFWR